MNRYLLVVLLLCSSCFVDLSRDEALLRLEIVNLSPQADFVSVRIEPVVGEIESMTQIFDISPCSECSGSLVSLPEISLPTGIVELEIFSLRSNNDVVDGPARGQVSLVEGLNIDRVNFGSSGPDNPSDDPPVVEIILSFSLEVNNIEVPIPNAARNLDVVVSAPLGELLADLRSRMSSEFRRVRVSRVDLRSLALPNDDEADSFENIWTGVPQIALVDGTTELSKFAPSVLDDIHLRASTSVDILDSWVVRPEDARIKVEGISPLDPDFPIRLELVVELAIL